MNFEEKVRKIIADNCTDSGVIDDLGINDNLIDRGLDSVTYIKIIVDIEKEFHITFPDDKLALKESDTIYKLCTIIESELENNI